MRSCRVQNWVLGGNLIGYTFMQNPRLNVQNTKKNKLDTSWEKLWSCRIQNGRLGAFLIIYTFKQTFRLKAKNTIQSILIRY